METKKNVLTILDILINFDFTHIPYSILFIFIICTLSFSSLLCLCLSVSISLSVSLSLCVFCYYLFPFSNWLTPLCMAFTMFY